MKYGESKTVFILLISFIYQRRTSELNFFSSSLSLATYKERINCLYIKATFGIHCHIAFNRTEREM